MAACEEEILFEEILSEEDEQLCIDNKNRVMEMVNGEIESIDYALKNSKIYDLESMNTNKNENKEQDIKYIDFHKDYQMVIELELVSNDEMVIIGVLIPKGYVLLFTNNNNNNNNNDKNVIWYDSIHNLLFKNYKNYEKLVIERLNKKLQSFTDQ